jgi:hypothetical protein
VRGRDALQRGDAEGAYQEFARLPDTSLFRAKPEVVQTISDLARSRLQEARNVMNSNRAEAARLAQSVMILPGVPADAVAQADQLLAEARRDPGMRANEVARAAPPPRQPTAPVAVAPTRPAAPPRAPLLAAAPPRSAPIAPARTTQPASPSLAVPAAGSSQAFETAQACVARGDNECVIRALEGNAGSPQALRLLIETYRTTGDVAKAQRSMTQFVKRFPDETAAKTYRRMLELQQNP